MTGNPAICFDVFRNVCVEQVELNMSNIRAPDLRQNFAFADQNFDLQGKAINVADELYRQFSRKCFTVVLLLPTVVPQSLNKITITIKQSDCDKWQTKIAG